MHCISEHRMEAFERENLTQSSLKERNLHVMLEVWVTISAIRIASVIGKRASMVVPKGFELVLIMKRL